MTEIVRLTEVGTRLVERGHDWFVADPDHAPGLACESLVIKVGENVSRVSALFRDDHADVPWRVIKDMRNRLTHYYEGTDYDVVWSTLKMDFPEISKMIRRLFQD